MGKKEKKVSTDGVNFFLGDHRPGGERKTADDWGIIL